MATGPSAWDLKQARLKAMRMARLGKLPGFGGVAKGEGAINYTVQAGDSWESIAGMFGGDQRKAYWLANKAGYSPFDVLQAGTQIKVPNGINGDWSPYINENFFTGIKYNDLQEGNRVDGYRFERYDPKNPQDRPWTSIDSDWLGSKFGGVLATPNYTPNYWANPANVVYWNNLIDTQAIPGDSWLDENTQKFIKDTYAYMEMRNGFKPNTEWGYLPDGDPNWGQLQEMPAPPEIIFGENGQVANPLAAIPEVGYNAVTNWQDPYFDWSKLSIEQKQAVIRDPNFNMHDVATYNQGMILSDPVFDEVWKEMPYFQQIYQKNLFSLFSNPATAPAAQGIAAGVITTSVAGPKAGIIAALAPMLLGYGQQLGGKAGETMQALGMALNKPAELVEQKAGQDQILQNVAKYQASGVEIPAWLEQIRKGTFDNLINAREQNIQLAEELKPYSDEEIKEAAWLAGKLAYETGELFRETGAGASYELFVTQLGETENIKVREGYTLTDATLRLLKGESYESIREDFIREYGITGVIADFGLQSVFDPLNVAPEIAGKARGKYFSHETVKLSGEAGRLRGLAEAAERAGNLAEADRLLGLANDTQAKARVQELHATANKMAPTLFGENILLWRSEAGRAFEGLAKSADMETLRAMTPSERKLAGLDADYGIAKLKPTPAESSKKSFRKAWSGLWGLNPEAKAIINFRNASNNMGVLLDWVKSDEMVGANLERALTALAERDINTLKDMGATFLDNPEFNTVLESVQGFLPKLKELNANFELAKIPRERFMAMMEIVGGDPATLLKGLISSDPRSMFKVVVDKARQLDTLSAKDFVAKVDRGEISAESIAKEMGVFRDGRVALYPEEHKYLVKAYYGEHFGNWAKKAFGITNEGDFAGVLRGLKGAQSLALLDINPAYMVNNFINNRVLMATHGVMGFTTDGRMNSWFQDFGVTPEGVREGYGASQYDAGTVNKQASDGSLGVKEEIPVDGQNLIREARQGSGLGSKIADFVGNARKVGVFGRLSAWLEGGSSKQMYYSAMRSFYGRRWTAGNGFKRMPELLRNRLTERGIDPNILERTIEGFVSANELDNLVKNTTNRSVGVLVNSAADTLGIDAGEASALLGHLGLLDELKDGLGQAKTDAEVKIVFDQIRERGEKFAAERWRNELLDMAKHSENKTKTEGLAGAVDAFDMLEDRYFETKIENDLNWDETFERLAETADNYDLRNVIIESTKSRASRRWEQAQDAYIATMKGIFDGINVSGADVERMLVLMGEKFKAYRTFFGERDVAYAAFFNDRNVKMSYADLERTWNKAWVNLVTEKIGGITNEFDDLFVKVFGEHWGEDGANLASAWRGDLRTIDGELLSMMSEHRANLANLDLPTRAARWKEFKPAYQAKWKERILKRNNGASTLYERAGEGLKTETPAGQAEASKPAVSERATQVTEAVERGKVYRAGKERHRTAIFELANHYGIATANMDGSPRLEAWDEIMAIVQEYGGANSPQWRRLDDVPLDVVDRAFDSWQHTGADVLTGIESPDSVVRRIMAEEWGGGEPKLESTRNEVNSRIGEIKKYGNGLPVRDAFKQKMLDMGIEAEVVNANMVLADAHAEVWGRGHGRDAGEWYETRIAGIEAGGVDKDGHRGMVERFEDGRNLITAFENADKTTVLHELGHIFRLDLEGEDLRIVEGWAGVEGGKWTIAAEERWVQGLEKYMSERQAPVAGLERVFGKFKSWVEKVYSGLRGYLDLSLNEEMLGVYDRLFVDEKNPAVKSRQEYLNETVVSLDDPNLISNEAGTRLGKLRVEIEGKEYSATVKIREDGIRLYKELVESGPERQNFKDLNEAVNRFVDEALNEAGIDYNQAKTLRRMDADSLSREQWELVDAAGLLEEIDLELGRVGEAWRVAEEAIGKAEGVSLRGAKSGHYLGNGMVYEKAGGKFYEVARNGSRGSEISTKEIRARGAEVLVPMGEAYKLQVEYERLLAQRGEVEEIGLQIGEKVKEEGKPGVSTDPRVLYQEGGQMPLYPVGGYDQTSGFIPTGEVLDSGWNGEVKPLLDAMERAAMDYERGVNYDGLDPETGKQLKGWLKDVRGDMAQVKHETVGWGNLMHDQALLNYNEQYGFDRLLNAVYPYQFFMTRSGLNWFVRGMDRPGFLSFYARFKNLQNTYKNQYPERTRNKIKVPMAWLGEWAGDGVWMSYQSQLMPWTMFTQPLEAMQRDENMLINNAAWVLRDWEQDGVIKPGEADTAINTQSGVTWERALEQARMDNDEQGGLFDYFGTLFSPALYITLPYYLTQGKKLGENGYPASPLPITRTGNAMKTAFKGTKLEWVGDVAGMLAAPENWYRESKGLSEFGEWGDFYVDRQLANMAAEGKYSVEEVQLAMIERQGGAYDEAMERVRFEVGMRVPGFPALAGAAQGAELDQVIGSLIPSLFSNGLLPPAEMEYKGLKQEYNLAWEAYNAGNKEALTEFFERYPEYEARLALRKDPEERLIQFLKSSIWDQYGELGATDRKQVRAYLGERFDDFLGSEPGVEFDPKLLANWAQLLGAAAPKGYERPAEAPQIPMIDERMTAMADQYFRQRSEKFPHYYELQSAYKRLAPSDRNGFMLRFPEYRNYLNWKDSWNEKYPELEPIIGGDMFRRVDTSGWSELALSAAMNYALTGDKLSQGAEKMLRYYWEMDGRMYDNFQAWLDSMVAPALLNGNEVIME